MAGGSRKGVTLKPGEEFLDFTILNHIFDLSRPGVYAVSVGRDFSLNNGPSPTIYTAISNLIKITILDSEKSQ